MELWSSKGAKDATQCKLPTGESFFMHGQTRELWIRLNLGIACRVEEHAKQQAAAIAARPPPPRPVGEPRKLPVVEAGKRESASDPSNGGRGRVGEGGRGAEPVDRSYPVSQRRSRLKKTHLCVSRGCYDAGRECQIKSGTMTAAQRELLSPMRCLKTKLWL